MTPDKVEAALAKLEVARNWADQVSQNGGVPRRIREAAMGQEYSLREALSVLTEALAERGWRPIESAPRDGTLVLLYAGNVGAIRGYWDCDKYSKTPRPYWTNDWERIGGRLETRANQPTHWQPLPEPPNDR